MKTKHLFYSLAMAAAFSACTQEELFDAPAQDNNALAGRAVVGNVTLVNDDVESRYNNQTATFEDGDKLGLYLMDSFDKAGELDNANDTYWNYQSTWWTMYKMEDYISSNYGYVYDADSEEWVNHASQLVEGNYIALFPQNVKATNRRDLWHPIKSNVDLVASTSKERYYVGRDNQFFVGYEQIKRDQDSEDAEGNLRAKISMKPILTYARIAFDNNQADKIRLKKVVFTNEDKSLLPNVAYVRPKTGIENSDKGIVMSDADAQKYLGKSWNALNPAMNGLEAPYWAWTNREAMAEWNEGYYCNGSKNIKYQGRYDRTTFTHAAARDMVVFETTGKVPYGMTATGEYAPSKEYTFNFPDDVELAGNYEENPALTKCQISIALPPFEGWNDMDVVVYADKWNGEEWVAGYISKKSGETDGEVNAAWNLDELSLWDESMPDFGTVELRIDDEYFVALNEISVGSDKDFYNLVKGRLADINTAKIVDLKVKPYAGTTLNVNKDVVDLINAYESNNGAGKVQITFEGEKVQLNVENTIHMFKFKGTEVTLNAPQKVTEAINANSGINQLNNKSTLTVLDNIAVNVYNSNSGTMIVGTEVVNNLIKTGSVGSVTNDGTLTLGDNASVGFLSNGKTVNVTAAGNNAANVENLVNNGDDQCNTCSKGKLNVAGALKADHLYNDGEINVTGTLTATSEDIKAIQNGENHVHAVINNNGTINGAIANNGIINNGNAEGGKGYINGTLRNWNEVNITAGDIKSIRNTSAAVLNVWSEEGISVTSTNQSNGTIVLKGVENGYVGTLNGSDAKVFEIQEAQKGIASADLLKMMKGSGTGVIWTAYDITLSETTAKEVWEWASANVTSLVVKGNNSVVTIKGEKDNLSISQAFKSTVIDFEKTTSKLVIANQTTLTVDSVVAGKEGQIDVTSGSSLKNKAGNEIDGTNKH